jgi:radical SAM protein with 4Fe4S-binding SPASM domain
LEQICLQTNGTLLTSEAVNLLQQLPVDRLTIQVSLDGAEAATHDLVRGSGSFTRTLGGIHRLVKAGMGPQMCLATTEMLHNFQDLPALLELAEALNIRRVIGNTLVKGGRASKNKTVDLPLPSQYLELIGRYQTDRRFKDIYHKRGNFAAIEWFKGRQTPAVRVCSCIKNLFITAQKALHPCVMFMHPEYAVSLHDERNLQGAVAVAMARWAQLPKISERRSREMALCETCPGQKHCAGGCMGRAYATFGDSMSVEDRCALRRAVYTWKKPPQT